MIIVYIDDSLKPKLGPNGFYKSFFDIPPATLNQASLFMRLKELAKRKWLNAGKPEGRDWEFWFAAEQEICLVVSTDITFNFPDLRDARDDAPDGYHRVLREHPNKTWHLEWEPVS